MKIAQKREKKVDFQEFVIVEYFIHKKLYRCN